MAATGPLADDFPAWFKDLERLKLLLADQQIGEVRDPKPIARLATPIPGIDALVIDVEVKEPQRDPQRQWWVFYTDQSGRYLFSGLLIDMEQRRNLNKVVERQVRGERADHPAHALNPRELFTLQVPLDRPTHPDTLIVVIDLGPVEGRQNFLRILEGYRARAQRGPVRTLKIAPVSAGQDEWATGAMALAIGYEALGQGGLARLEEFSTQGRQASWLQRERLANDVDLKRALGHGVFHLDDNSAQALLARVDRLPLVYLLQGDQVRPILPIPTTPAEWDSLFAAPSD